MHFSASSAFGLGLMAAHATAVALPDIPGLVGNVLATTVTVVSTVQPATVTITATVTQLLPKASANSTVSTNNTSTLSTLSITVPSTLSTLSIKVPSVLSTASAIPTTPPTSGLTADQQKALDLHNTARAAVGNGKLTWNADLAKSAQAWADNLTTKGGLVHDTNTGGQGENLASQLGGTDTYYANAVQLWLNEKSLYNGQPIAASGSPNYMDYGHYTQAIWKSTEQVGLALATDSKGTVYVVARYLPAGNYIGQMPY